MMSHSAKLDRNEWLCDEAHITVNIHLQCVITWIWYSHTVCNNLDMILWLLKHWHQPLVECSFNFRLSHWRQSVSWRWTWERMVEKWLPWNPIHTGLLSQNKHGVRWSVWSWWAKVWFGPVFLIWVVCLNPQNTSLYLTVDISDI